MARPGDEKLEPDDLLPLVYEELRRLAGGYLKGERVAHTLQPTALVHEAYLRIQGQGDVRWKSPGHLRAVCAQAMRRILVDHARARMAAKRGGGARAVTLASQGLAAHEVPLDVLEVEEALQRLEALSERQARIVELRFFGGLTSREAAEVLGISETTAEDQWRFARAWLNRELAR